MIDAATISSPRDELDTLAILKMCDQGFIPANTMVGPAIEAHRMAFDQFTQTKHESDWPLAWLTLRAVWLSVARTREDAQEVFDYLNALPMLAWQNVVSRDAEWVRETILADCTRQIMMRTDA